MWKSDLWKEYELIDTSDGERLERWGDVVLVRPDPQVIWKGVKRSPLWKKYNARYNRSKSGGGAWDVVKLPKDALETGWTIDWENLTFRIKPTGFKHTGIFPEQGVNWKWMQEKIKTAKRPINVLNLFAYTGGATLACASAGASVCHVDASRGIVAWAKENASLSGLKDAPIRYIVDDCKKFLEREIRRGRKYDAVIMDPPSYGRGPGGEVWKLEDGICELLSLTSQVLSEDPLFVLVNSYTTGLSASTVGYLLSLYMKDYNGYISAEEIGIPVKESGMALPAGASARWEALEAQ